MNNRNDTNILFYILFSVVGFGIGGAIGGAIWVALDAPHIGFAVLGVIGGASLGMALRDWKRIWILALIGGIGFDIGLLVGFFVPMVLLGPANNQSFFVGTLGGAIGGASIGIALKSWKKTGVLSLAAAIGFTIAAWLTWDTLRGFTPQILGGAISLAIWGIIGGAFLGLALGLLERKH